MTKLLVSHSVRINLEPFQMHYKRTWSPLDHHLPRSDLFGLTLLTIKLVIPQHPLFMRKLFDAVIETGTLLFNIDTECHKGFLSLVT